MYSYSNVIQMVGNRRNVSGRQSSSQSRVRRKKGSGPQWKRDSSRNRDITRSSCTEQSVSTTLTLHKQGGGCISAKGESGVNEHIPKEFGVVKELFNTFESGKVYKYGNGKKRVTFVDSVIEKNEDNKEWEKYECIEARTPYHCAEPNALVNALWEINKEKRRGKNIQFEGGKFTRPETTTKPCGVCRQWIHDEKDKNFTLRFNILEAINKQFVPPSSDNEVPAPPSSDNEVPAPPSSDNKARFKKLAPDNPWLHVNPQAPG